MSERLAASLVDRVWNRLEDSYDTGTVACDCTASGDAIAALEDSAITRAQMEAYRRGDVSMDELLAGVDADLDPEPIDDLVDLGEALTAVHADTGASSTS